MQEVATYMKSLKLNFQKVITLALEEFTAAGFNTESKTIDDTAGQPQ